MKLEIEVAEKAGNKCTVALNGRLDATTALELDDRLKSAVEPGVRILVLDMKELSYISSAGLRVIFKARNAVHGNGGKIVLVGLQPQVKKVFEIVKALPDLTVFSTIQEMDEYLDAMQRRSLEKE